MELQEYVIELLKNYNHMKQEIQTLEYELRCLMASSKDEMIESMNFSPPSDERIQVGGISDKTPMIALNYEQRFTELKQEALNEVIGRLRCLKESVDRLDFYINQLEAYQASILKDYYFEGYSWRELQDLRGVTSKTLMKHRDDAIKALTIRYHNIERIGLL